MSYLREHWWIFLNLCAVWNDWITQNGIAIRCTPSPQIDQSFILDLARQFREELQQKKEKLDLLNRRTKPQPGPESPAPRKIKCKSRTGHSRTSHGVTDAVRPAAVEEVAWNTWEAMPIIECEERERVARLKQRERYMRSIGLISYVHRTLVNSPGVTAIKPAQLQTDLPAPGELHVWFVRTGWWMPLPVGYTNYLLVIYVGLSLFESIRSGERTWIPIGLSWNVWNVFDHPNYIGTWCFWYPQSMYQSGK